MQKTEKVIPYIAILNTEGLVFFQVEHHPEFLNPDSIEVNEENNKIIFNKNNVSLVMENIKEDIKVGILLDKGFDLYELDKDLNPISNYRYGEPHVQKDIKKLKKVF